MKDKRFTNRRRMAWTAFIFMLVISAWMIYKGVSDKEASVRIEQLSFLLGSVFGLCTTIVVTYFTTSTITQVTDIKSGTPTDTHYGP